ncbi:MAG: PaaX family transcriptional regulator C-terminal domain-containing protein [Rhodoferax sp.]
MTPAMYHRETGNPKTLVLDLLLASADAPMPVSHLLAAAALFGITENHLRVTLVRLAGIDMVVSTERGHYSLGPAARSLAQDVGRWRQARQRLRPHWAGDYLAAYTAPARGTRAAAGENQHLRALQLLGFAEFAPGLHLRPHNLDGSLEEQRQRLLGLGLHAHTHMFVVQSFGQAEQAQAQSLWDGSALNNAYRATRDRLQQWLQGASALDPASAARESYLLGGSAIRQLIFDPLLPAPLVDAGARDAFIDAVLAMDHYGRGVWQQFFAHFDPSTPP